MRRREIFTKRLRAPSPYAGAVGAVEFYARRHLELQLTEPQAVALWSEVQAQLQALGLRHVVDEVLSGTTTSCHSSILDAMARVLSSGESGWPRDCGGRAEFDRFAHSISAAVQARGYEFIVVSSVPSDEQVV